MTTTSTKHETTIEADPDLPTVKITREFDAPVDKVWRAHVDPDLVVQWLGPRSIDMDVDTWDIRTGGSYRYTALRDGEEIAHFYGSVHRVDLLNYNLRRLKGSDNKWTLAEVTAAMNAAATQDVRAIDTVPLLRRLLVGSQAPNQQAAKMLSLLVAWRNHGGSRLDRDLDGKIDDPGAAIMDAAWPNTVVEESNLSVQIASLRKLLGTCPDGAGWISTVPRIGYRFAGPLIVQNGGDNSTGADRAADPARRPSIAVLPFVNLSGDPGQEHFADGISEDIIAALSRFRWFFVVARNSSFAYKGRPINVKLVARDTTEPSPLSHEVINAKPYAFLDDAPLEERRTQAVLTRRGLDVKTADELGFYAAYSADETWHKDMWLIFAAAADKTTNIRFGPNLTHIILKEPTILAQQLATLDELTGGRAEAVVSFGNLGMLQQYGIDWSTQRPLARLREGVHVMRTFLDEGAINFDGDFFTYSGLFTFARPVQEHLPLKLGGMGGPRSFELAGEISDGLHHALGYSRENYDFVAEHFRAGAEKAGKNPEDLDLGAWVLMGFVGLARDEVGNLAPEPRLAPGFSLQAETALVGQLAATLQEQVGRRRR